MAGIGPGASATTRCRPCLAPRKGDLNMTAPPCPENDRDCPSVDLHLSEELAAALRAVVIARDRLRAESPQSADYQATLAGYLKAAVHHLAILAVAQAQ